jgi:hypothetical protein
VTPAALRRALGGWSVTMGLAHVLPVLFVALSAAGPSPVAVSGRAMSLFYYGHFIALTAGGLGWLLLRAWRDKVFHGGPFIDFALVLTGFFLAASVSGWLAGPALAALGARLLGGRPFFNPL